MFQRRRIDVLAYDGVYAAEVFAVADILSVADAVARAQGRVTESVFDVRVVSVDSRQVRLANGSTLGVSTPRAAADVLVVPGFSLVDTRQVSGQIERLDAEVAYIRRRSRDGTALAGVCLGTYLLAEAGALDGRSATTSWLFAAELARRYPAVDVRATSMIVEDPPVITAGAFSAGQDLALFLVRQFTDAATARDTSKVTLVSESRSTQAPYVDDDLVLVQHASFVDDVRRHLRHHLAEPYDLPGLAAQFNVSTRTLLRRFSEATAGSPQAYLQRLRVDAARRLLESSDLTVGEIAGRVGYADVATFRKHFTNTVGSTPLAYRRQVAAAGAARPS